MMEKKITYRKIHLNYDDVCKHAGYVYTGDDMTLQSDRIYCDVAQMVETGRVKQRKISYDEEKALDMTQVQSMQELLESGLHSSELYRSLPTSVKLRYRSPREFVTALERGQITAEQALSYGLLKRKTAVEVKPIPVILQNPPEGPDSTKLRDT